MKLIRICGVPYTITESEDVFGRNIQGQIDYNAGTIQINKDMAEPVKAVALCHEITHGMLVAIGRNDLAEDEVFTQALASAINMAFTPKIEANEVEE